MSNPNVTIDRQKYIGGSDLPTILGLNTKYGTNIFEFAKQKAGIIPNTFKGNQYTKYGQIMEPIIRDYINSIMGTNYLEDTVIDNNRSYRGNTDGIDRNASTPIIEIKTFGEELDAEYYTPQCQFYMETFNVNSVLLIGYKRPSDFYTGVDYDLENDNSYFNIEFDPDRIVQVEILRDRQMWKKIEMRIVAFKNAVNELKKNPNMSETKFNEIFFGNDLISLSNELTILEDTLMSINPIKYKIEDIKSKIYNLCDENGITSFETDRIKITKVNPTEYVTVSIDLDKLKKEKPNIYEEFKKTKKINKKGYILITVKKEEDKNVITSE